MEILDFLKEYWIAVVLFLFGIAVIYVVGTERFETNCSKMNPNYCEKDEDCICMDYGCFLGNKNYYEKCVDKSKSCLDMCYGWDQPSPRCIDNTCVRNYAMP